MKTRDDILNELKELNSSLPAAKPQEAYVVPAGYFDGLAASVLSKIKEKENAVQEEIESISPVLAALPRKMPFSVPENYFNNTTAGLADLIKEDSLPQVLADAGKDMPYSVPDGYFAALPEQVLARINKPATPAKVVPMQPKRWMHYAAAAMVAGIIALSTISYFSAKPSIDPNKHPEEWVASKLKNVSNKDLEEFIKTADVKNMTGAEVASGTMASHTEVRKMLRDVSDSELDDFLNQVPGDNEELSIIN